MKRILVLGAGLVSRPLVRYLTDIRDYEVTVATRTVKKAEALIADRPNGKAIAFDVTDTDTLEELVKQHDIAISLLPATEHVKVAQSCLRNNKHMATTSYISEEMQKLHQEAAGKDLSFLNECGVDPGIDHMSAMRVIHSVAEKGGKIVSFRSYCGGLPAPEANTNPIGYKFSWAPRGVLVAATNNAKYRKNGKIVEVPGNELFKGPEIVEIPDVGKFEGYPNRDSLPYAEMYGLKDAKTMYRGTLRNPGHCEAWYHWVNWGLFKQEARSDLGNLTYRRFMQGFADGAGNISNGLAKKAGIAEDSKAIQNLKWLGMFDDKIIPLSSGGNIDVMAGRMQEKCSFEPGERDMIAMQHEFIIEYPDKTEQIYSTIIDYGIPNGDSSMARTVSLPVAIGTRMILEGTLTQRGIVVPITPEVYNPILDELAALGITCKERSV